MGKSTAPESKIQAKVREEIKKSPHQKVKIAITDTDGVLRGKYLHKDKFLGALDSGFGFCNVIFGWDSSDVCYDNSKFTGWHTGYPDALARIDLKTFRHVPWDQNVPFFLADFEEGTSKHPSVCPRRLLKDVLKRVEKAGYKSSSGMEFEWFNFKETSNSIAAKQYVSPEPLTPGMFGYSLNRLNQNTGFFNSLMDELLAFKVPIEGLHTETGPGVTEVAILYSDSLEAADRAVLFKAGAKEIGHRYGIMPSFMAKWNASLPGCSGHTHQSLWAGDRNLFYDEKKPHKMSEVFKSYLAGQMLLLPDILPFFAPTVNSYKRLVDGYWAPTKVTWGIDNRTVAFRVIPGNSKSTRVEVRVPGSDTNPYLCIAAATAAGLYGVENGLKLKAEPIIGSAYMEKHSERLPKNLHEAALKLSRSKLAREILGDAYVEHFTNTRIWEWRQFQDSVTNWELQRYFEII